MQIHRQFEQPQDTQSTLWASRSMLFVYGPPGSGKSTVGRLLAEALGLPFWDVDAEIESLSGMSIAEIFAQEQEHGFRRREKAVLSRLLSQEKGVFALGGGALLDMESRAQVEAAGPVVFLAAPVDTLVERLGIKADQRPLLANPQVESTGAGSMGLRARLVGLLAGRAGHYASFPLAVETAGQSSEEVAWQAQVLLGAFRVSGMGPGYDVRVQSAGLDQLGAALQLRGIRGPLALVSDANVGAIYGSRAMHALRSSGYAVQSITIPAGESHKNLQSLTHLWEAFLAAGIERGSTVLALGGGVVGDLSGFAAATFLRGVRWVAVPTSLLSMVDASLGGKTGVDLPQGKNLVGAFHPPALVLADPTTLFTLPEGELRSGMAEVVKHGLIDDPALFDLCAQGWGGFQHDWGEIVRRAMAVKVRVIRSDPYEQGWRAALNLGHTVGHAVELASGFRLRHGEAVAIGLVVEARLAERLGLAEPGLSEQIAAVLSRLGLPAKVPPRLSREVILHAMGVDKKRAGGQVRFSLPVKIGETRLGVAIEDLDSIFDVIN